MSIKNFFVKIETVNTRDFYGEEITKKVEYLRINRVIICAIALLLAVVLPLTMIRTVPTGYTGILTTFGRVEDNTVSAGVHIIAPWQKIVKLDNRAQKVQIQTEAFSSDIQQVTIDLSLNYCIDQETAQELYKTVGINYYDNVLYPRILENVKAVFAEYTAEDLISNRSQLSDEIVANLTDDAANYSIRIISLSIEDIDFTEAFTNAVEAKQVAAQDKLTAETKQAQQTMEQEAEAERAVIKANAEAEQSIIAAQAELEVTKIQAEAALYAGEKEAEANKRIAESLTPDLVKYYYIRQWDGALPKTVLGDSTSFMVNLAE